MNQISGAFSTECYPEIVARGSKLLGPEDEFFVGFGLGHCLKTASGHARLILATIASVLITSFTARAIDLFEFGDKDRHVFTVTSPEPVPAGNCRRDRRVCRIRLVVPISWRVEIFRWQRHRRPGKTGRSDESKPATKRQSRSNRGLGTDNTCRSNKRTKAQSAARILGARPWSRSMPPVKRFLPSGAGPGARYEVLSIVLKRPRSIALQQIVARAATPVAAHTPADPE